MRRQREFELSRCGALGGRLMDVACLGSRALPAPGEMCRIVTLFEKAARAVTWILAKLLKALAWLIVLVSLCGLLATFPAIGLPVILSVVPLMVP